MLFYEVIGEDGRPAYASTLAQAHRLAKCKRPYPLVTIEEVVVDTMKAGIQQLLDAIFSNGPKPELWHNTNRKRWGLTPRGGLRPLT